MVNSAGIGLMPQLLHFGMEESLDGRQLEHTKVARQLISAIDRGIICGQKSSLKLGVDKQRPLGGCFGCLVYLMR